MSSRLLIDATSLEEIRVAVLNEKNILEDFDREATFAKRVKGNIYLAKIIKIEPSLQAAFVDYGSEKHGFISISDIHPDYYNIPEDQKNDLTAVKFLMDNGNSATTTDVAAEQVLEADSVEDKDSQLNYPEIIELHDNNVTPVSKSTYPEVDDILYAEDEILEHQKESQEMARRYQIEKVLKEGQSLLVQVLKEERGNKGVTLTTYISIAGKYSILLISNDHKGGISKKIQNAEERKTLREIMNTLDQSNSKSTIIRTAGVGKKTEEIAKDYSYLLKLWDAIRRKSIESKALTFIHSEDDIIRRTIRDLYNDHIGEVIIEGKKAFETFKLLLHMVIPRSKSAIIRHHEDKIPIFHKYGIESQLEKLYCNRVELSTGGSIVIDQTEALVAIDVNSGKATREKNVEEMALATNLEAAKEIARQLRLRGIGGLLVVDFIDMYDNKNRRRVEKTMQEEIKLDRARTQVGRISSFGLLEMSRQRTRASLFENIYETCHNCDGQGVVRSRQVTANGLLRHLRLLSKEKSTKIVDVSAHPLLVNFLLNYRRSELIEVEKSTNFTILITADSKLTEDKYELKKRNFLTEEERMNLLQHHQIGEVNKTFDFSTMSEENQSISSDKCFSHHRNNSLPQYRPQNPRFSTPSPNNLKPHPYHRRQPKKTLVSPEDNHTSMPSASSTLATPASKGLLTRIKNIFLGN
jgi:ribonuclease E